MIAKLMADAVAAGCTRIVVAYEDKGYGFYLYDELVGAGIECFVLVPFKIEGASKQTAEMIEERDSRALLEMLRGHIQAGHELPSLQVPTLQERDELELALFRRYLADDQSRIKEKIDALLERNGVKWPSDIGKGWTTKHQAWLEELSQSGLCPGATVVLESLLRELKVADQEIIRTLHKD